MKYCRTFFTFVVISLIALVGLTKPVAAEYEGGIKNDPIVELIEDGEYQKAIEAAREGLEENPDNADLYNLIAYSYRKSGQFEPAFKNYFKALEIDPKHRGANEYLGELYLQTDQLVKAEERLKVLDDECFFPCKEYSKLKDAIEEYKKKNSS